MCGRFTQTHSAAEVAEHFGLPADPAAGDAAPAPAPRFNIAPMQPVPIVRQRGPARVLETRQWGLVPGWASQPSVGSRMINARSESAASKPAFRDALAKRRCLVPADGFYEWLKAGRSRAAFHLALPDGALFAMAGLYEEWDDAGDRVVPSFTILTRAATATVAPVHDRMPLIVDPEAYAAWLDPDQRDGERAIATLPLGLGDRIVRRRVSARVNDVRNDDPACLAPDSLPLFGGAEV
jgi:putative SOS response-associated peptidase YedK